MSFFQLKMEWCWNRIDATFESVDTTSKDENGSANDTDDNASDNDIDDNASDNDVDDNASDNE